MKNQQKTKIQKIADWFQQKDIDNSPISPLFGVEHIHFLNEKLKPHKIWIERKPPESDYSIGTTWFSVHKIKQEEGDSKIWKNISKLFPYQIEKTYIKTSEISVLRQFLNANFSKELDSDNINQLEPIKNDNSLNDYVKPKKRM